MEIAVTVEGVQELTETLTKMGDQIRRDILANAVMDAGQLLVDEARRNAPVAYGRTPKGHKPGTLRDRGIGWNLRRRISDEDAATVGVGFTKKGWYGIFAELGSSNESPRPFIVPAFERLKPEILANIGNVVSRFITSWDEGAKVGAFRPRN